MKKQTMGAAIKLIVFVLLVAVGIYTLIFGIQGYGMAKSIKLGLDLAGGVSITYQIDDADADAADVNDTIYRLQQRVDAWSNDGVVYKSGNDRITVEIPGAENANEILADLGRTGELLFLDPENFEKWANGEEYEPALTGNDIKNAQAGIDDSGSIKDYVVQLQFTDEGVKKFADVTSANVGKPVYIIYDGEVVSYPTVQEAITSGNAVINSISDFETADSLATTIRIGALPCTLTELNSSIVGASLGSEAVSTSLKAGLIGTIIVCVIMIIFYLLPGFVSALALIAYVALTLLCLNAFDITLTLPGMAGIILTIGMAVDANVIIFTRIKEELAAGNSVKASIDAGFHKAMSAILDGNITTLIAAVVLLVMGTGSIQGFAKTLAIGIVLSMFTALFITRQLLNACYALGLKDAKFYGKAKPVKNVRYTKFSKFCMIGSVIVILLGFVMMPINKATIGKTLNYSLEFTGGTSITLVLDKDYTLAEVEDTIEPVIADAAGITTAGMQAQTVEGAHQVIIKMPELTVDQRKAVEDACRDQFTVNEFSDENISSTFSGEMRRNAIISVTIATILMLIYIAFRFSDIRFGASAVIALLHDVLIVFTVYSIAKLSVGNTFIACMLTIVGYSINATIIIFDRIRENKRIMSADRDGLDQIVDTSINQTFSRTIFTSLTTFVMVLVLYIMGVVSIREFALTLMAGIICGAYSSVCITGPLWWMMTKSKKAAKKVTASPNKKKAKSKK